MKISRNLPQFENEPTLLVVSGKQHGVLYVAENGTIVKQTELYIPTPHYGDREGFFVQGGRGGIQAASAVYESQDGYVMQEYLRELTSYLHTRLQVRSFRCLYLFAPRHHLYAIERKLPPEFKRILTQVFDGNYTEAHPFQLLERIARREATRNGERPQSRDEVRVEAVAELTGN